MNREEAKDFINTQEPTFLQKTKRGYICPACGQGANKGNGITRATGRRLLWHCVNEQKERSIIGLFAIHSGIPDEPKNFIEILDKAAAYYGITIEAGSDTQAERPSPSTYTHTHTHNNTQTDTQGDTDMQKQAAEPDYTEFFREAHKHIAETDYLKKRGISQESADRFCLGYVKEWRHPKSPNAPASPRLIIPTSKYSYLARDTRDEQEIPEKQRDYIKIKTGKIHLFNPGAIQNDKKPVFIVESEIDAISIIEAGGEAAALGSAQQARAFIAFVKANRPSQPLIIALDNDKPGNEAAEKLAADLAALQILFYRPDISKLYAGEKDANEALIKDREALSAAIYNAETEAASIADAEEQAERDAYLKNSAAARLEQFIAEIRDGNTKPAIKSGFSNLDNTLDGGLYTGLYILGAESGTGKTTFILQLADQLAQNGTDIIIFSFERTANELIAKSLSRYSYLIATERGKPDLGKDARGIMDGTRYAGYTEEEKEIISEAENQYRQLAGNIVIIEGDGNTKADEIRAIVEKHKKTYKKTPVLMFDYLQMMPAEDPKLSDKQKVSTTVSELMNIKREYDTPVIAISSLNRQNYDKADKGMGSYKESGEIEYSGDVLTMLSDSTKAGEGTERDIALTILKSRLAPGKGSKLHFTYLPKYNLFKERVRPPTRPK